MRTVELLVHVAECQRCMQAGPEAATSKYAEVAARNAGWLEVDGKTLCRDCKEEVQEEKKRRRVGVGLDAIVAAVVNKESGDAN